MKLAFLALSLALTLAACGQKEAASVEDLTEVAEKGTAALKSAPPEIKFQVDQAAAAMKADDQATAVLSLRSVRASGQLTPDQAIAVEDMMAKARGVLSERAARGDQQAIAALHLLNQNPPR